MVTAATGHFCHWAHNTVPMPLPPILTKGPACIAPRFKCNKICYEPSQDTLYHRHPHISGEREGVLAAAAKSLQSCPTLCDPIDCSPPGSPVPGILQARTLEWVAISFSSACTWKVKVKSLSGVLLLVTPSTAAYQVPPSMGFSRQEYWSGVPLPSPIGGLKCGCSLEPSKELYNMLLPDPTPKVQTALVWNIPWTFELLKLSRRFDCAV